MKFVFPSIMSMIAISFYTTVDGLFVSRYVGADALASINIIIPYACIVYAVAMMLATGSGAYIAMFMGEGKEKKASGHLSYTALALLAAGIVLCGLSLAFFTPGLKLLGSTELLMPYTRVYGYCTVAAVIPMMFKLFLEQLVRVDGNPQLSFSMSISGLIANFILDAIFTKYMKLGILGAGLGTIFSILLSTLMGLFYFAGRKSGSRLKFIRPCCEKGFLLKSCINGASQFLTELSTGVVTLIFNLTMLRLAGENGVAAVTVITFFYYFFLAVYMGLASGTAPAISFARGAENREKERELSVFGRNSLFWISPAITLISYFGTVFLVGIFTKDPGVSALAEPGNRLFSFCYLFAGVSIFYCAYYTAIGEGRLAGFISAMRCLVFSSLAIILLGKFFGINGVWLALPAAEFASMLLCFAVCMIRKK